MRRPRSGGPRAAPHAARSSSRSEVLRRARAWHPSGVSIEFLVTTLIVVATPGTGVIYTLAAGLSRGARASVIAAFGCTLGIVPHVLAAMTGMAAVLNASAIAFQALKIAGAGYLAYLAWATLREDGALAVDE